ncbi:PREDICTED: salicylate/benzoate carboxyl methyltransferase-like isoform X1 [Camelina sativa]|uniref:Salicylate/benzoate carboxyl methyltransferase-like isoform X1 n=1 Tax=Camelina sativa TaxID=90675 RepID=A0ABM0W4C3_CAMSA|nr:PREDICTED: salicylate/benzoate carboxyl methyltransferase-like isoform X1 [Camelina sativa]
MEDVDSIFINTINRSSRCNGKSGTEKYNGNDERSGRYPFVKALSMSGGDGDNSYSTNSLLQKRVIRKVKPVLVKNTQGMMKNLNFPNYIKVADLGCATGQNTFLTMSEIVNTITVLCQQCNQKLPEIDCCLNDLPCNDFNTTFKFIAFFNKIVKSKGLCFVSGSFYSRLFPSKSLHFVHSSYSLHWLSKVPKGLEKDTSCVYITASSPPSTYKAYLTQFQSDFTTFLKMRSEEMVWNGRMVLTFIGRETIDDPLHRDCCHFWTLLSTSLRDLVSEGLVSASKVGPFNMPFYDPSKEEAIEMIRKEGSFEINDLEIHGFDLHQSNYDEDYKLHSQKSKAGEKEAKCIRAVSESLLVAHFGVDVMDTLFNKFAYHVSQHTSCTNKTTVSLVVSLIRK